MLYISRRIDESILIDGKIEIIVSQISGKQVKLGVDAPRNTTVYRKELLEKILQENRTAYESVNNILSKEEYMKSNISKKVNELNFFIHKAREDIKKGNIININDIFKLMTDLESFVKDEKDESLLEALDSVLENYESLLIEINKQQKAIEDEIKNLSSNLKAMRVYKNAK